MARRSPPTVWVALTLAAMLAAPSDAQSQAPATHTVVMANMRFGQLPSSVKRGDTILWVNKDTVPHSATARDRSFDVRVAPRKNARTVVKKAGTISIYCIYHPAMRATLKVAQ